MKSYKSNYSNIMSLISSILFFILGAIMFSKPEAIILFISYVIGGIIIIIGTFNCIKNYLDIKKDNSISSKEMILGIILIIIGLVFIFLADVIETIVRFIIGGWILFTGINRLINTLQLTKKDNKFISQLIISILLVGIGMYTILKSNLAFKTIGIVIIIYSIIEIIGYILNRQTKEIIIETKEVIDMIPVETKKKKKKSK